MVLSTIWVTTTADVIDADPDVTSLREAILAANSSPGGDVVRFASRLHGTITLDKALGSLEIRDDLAIAGPGADRLAVSGDDAIRVIYVAPAAVGTEITVSMAGLTITRGRAEALETVLRSHGGAILNDIGSHLSLSDVVLSHNKAVGMINVNDELRHLGGAAGGGVANKGELTVTGCTFIDNQALAVDGQGGADAVFAFRDGLPLGAVKFPGIALGGGLWNWMTGTATILDSRFIDNLAKGGDGCEGTFAGLSQGGAIYNDNDLDITRTLFSTNRAVGGSNTYSDAFSGEALGGAISSGTNERLLVGVTASAVITVDRSIFTDNHAIGGNDNVASAFPLGAVPSAGGGFGGAIAVFQGEATITSSTLAHNAADGGVREVGRDTVGQGGGMAVGGGIWFVNFLGRMTEAGPAGVKGAVQGCALVHNASNGGCGAGGARGGNALGGGWAAGSFGLTPLVGNITISNTIVSHNRSVGGDGSSSGGGDGLGGGAYNGAGSTVAVTTSALIHNQASGGRGTGSGSGGSGIGGGIDNVSDSTGVAAVSVSSTVFVANQALGGVGLTAGAGNGGAINSAGSGGRVSVVTISDAAFARNQAIGGDGGGNANGGAISNLSSSRLSVSDGKFTGNQARGGDGGVGGAAVSTLGTAFGGAIRSGGDDNSIASIVASRFINNQAVGGDGGAGGTGTLTMVGNALGGAVMQQRGSVTVTESDFTGNRAIGGDDGSGGTAARYIVGVGTGGALCVIGTPAGPVGFATVDACNFTNNHAVGGAGNRPGSGASPFNALAAAIGGAIGSVDGGNLAVANSVIARNQAVGGTGSAGHDGGDALGGGIGALFCGPPFSNSSNLTVTSTTLNHNQALGGRGGAGGKGGTGLGGGLFSDVSAAVISGNTFFRNAAIGGKGKSGGDGGNGLGGGLFNRGGAALDDCLITANRAAGGGASTSGVDGTGVGGGVYNDTEKGATISIDALDRIFANFADEFENCFGCPT